MNKITYISIIQDAQHAECSDTEIESLLGIYASTLMSVATTRARKLWFSLSDFEDTKEYGTDQFSLILERRDVRGQEQWCGTFGCGSKNLRITAKLED